ncbi:hypothetical protein IU451_28965 [Nocardia cyriacigeorgica]|uniref:hypothetical protein n=1 Tax=Nocardia cyriacigeorgica TaxID=135487 RepID=UPI0018932003|nr:hypothetical protein [Nocardia cyriacigeorgica]MBF6326535.1 hypothetical protein [Nocardia cyriacigeorgica]
MSSHDRWKDAVCRRDDYVTWMHKHRASMWDAHVEGETERAKERRLFKARGLCFSCTLRTECADLRNELAKQYGYVPGVWGAKIYPLSEPHIDNAPATLDLAFGGDAA